MTLEETGVIMDILAAAYPRFCAGRDAHDLKKAVELWAGMFAEDDVVLVAAAVKALIATDDKGFPPHIGAVKAKLRQITVPQQMDAATAWGLVMRATQRALYGSREEFDKLPEPVRRVVGSPQQLRAWAMMDAETVQSVVASNFQRAYRARAQSDREYQALPADVKKLISAAAGRLALEGRKE